MRPRPFSPASVFSLQAFRFVKHLAPLGTGFFPLALALSAAPLVAQDVTIGAPVTFAGLDVGKNSIPLKLKSSSKPKYPAALRDTNTYGYAIAFSPTQKDKDKGEIAARVAARLSYRGNTTHKEIESVCHDGLRYWEWEGVDNKNDPRQAWVAILFNPASASDSKKKKDAAPRLLDVVPVFLPTAKISSKDRVAQADVTVGASGEIKSVKLTSPNTLASQNETAITDAVSKWKIAPARANGIPTEATITVPVLLLPDPSMQTTDRPTGTTARSTTRTTSHSPKTSAPATTKTNSTGITQLTPTKEAAADYPKSAGDAIGRTAKVTIEFTLDDKGRPKNPTVVLSPNKQFDAPALKAIGQYRFEKPDPSKPDSLGNTYAKLSDARWQYVVNFRKPLTTRSGGGFDGNAADLALIAPKDWDGLNLDVTASGYGNVSPTSSAGRASRAGRPSSMPMPMPMPNPRLPPPLDGLVSSETPTNGQNISCPVLAPESVETVAPVYPYQLLKTNVTGRATVRMPCNAILLVAAPDIIDATQKSFGLALAAAMRFYKVTTKRVMGTRTSAMITATFDFTPANPELHLPEKTLQLLADETNNPTKIIPEDKLDKRLKIQAPAPTPSKIFSTPLNPKSKGTTIIEFLVDETGRVHLPRIVLTEVPEAAYLLMQQISMRTYDPPMQNGHPVVARAREKVIFDATRNLSADAQ